MIVKAYLAYTFASFLMASLGIITIKCAYVDYGPRLAKVCAPHNGAPHRQAARAGHRFDTSTA